MCGIAGIITTPEGRAILARRDAGERLNGIQEVVGSIPIGSTI